MEELNEAEQTQTSDIQKWVEYFQGSIDTISETHVESWGRLKIRPIKKLN